MYSLTFAVRSRRRWLGVVVSALAAAAPAAAQSPGLQELRRELGAVKRQLAEMEKTIRKQQAVIEKLTGEKGAPGAVVSTPPGTPSAPPPSPSPAPVATAAREPWSPSQPIRLLGGTRGYLNLSFDALVDAGWSTEPEVTRLERGDHDPLQRGFTLPNEEIFLNGAVDPYFTGVADLVFKLDQDNATNVELEEVYLTTTSLPWNLQAKGGQFFTEFGRINQQHPHAWDFVNQPLVIGRMFGPEGLRNPGARLSWLTPTPFYSELLLTVQNSHGDTAFSFRNTKDELFGRMPVERKVHGVDDLLYTPRYVASFDLTDSQTVVAGVSAALAPNASGRDTRTQVYGGDLYWKWKPPWQAGGFPFVAWQTEALGRRYEAGADPAVPLPSERLYDWGVYSQLVWGFTQRWVAGLRGDWVSGDRGAFRHDDNRADRFRASPNLTFYPTEFSKIRLQYDYDHGQHHGSDSSLWLQLEFLLGEHAAHKF